MHIKKNKKGFTLIELLVVIAIIVILTGIVVTNLTQARARSRDGKRISDIAQIQLALELFYDRCGQYPRNLDINYACPTNAQVKLVNYISKIPTIPTPTVAGYTSYTSGYWVNSNNPSSVPVTDYIIKTVLEGNNVALDETYTGVPSGTFYLNGSGSSSFVPCNPAAKNYCVVPK